MQYFVCSRCTIHVSWFLLATHATIINYLSSVLQIFILDMYVYYESFCILNKSEKQENQKVQLSKAFDVSTYVNMELHTRSYFGLQLMLVIPVNCLLRA